MTARRPEGVTIRAVGERAGVSAMTVSNVINGAGRVGATTRAAVLAAIEELGYVPNVAARRLAKARATTLGLVYSDRSTPFIDSVLLGALRASNARGLQFIAQGEEGLTRDAAEAAVRALVQSGAAGVLLVPPFAELLSGSGLFEELGVAAAAIATGQALPDIATVRIDNRAGMAAMTAHVAQAGHRRIGLIAGPQRFSVADERLAGFRDGLAAAGLAYDPALVIQSGFDPLSGAAAGRVLLDLADRPSAILCSSDDMAAGLIGEAHRMGLRLPDDLAVTGFDDTAIASRVWPPLTVIRQPVEDMAFGAVEQVLAALRSRIVEDRVMAFELVVRDSVGRG
ncbi:MULTISPECIES: LacI family DNA-binding transcriptional regulator [unclassified Sphingomonas]|uniref:LacI family DNA-binding transcriptional regulator n=1 Tax=unclassified Sphingomonas TaxID=196159 RepID=UPI0028565587|nr:MULTISPECIES: LacI family DNA-binding transcriptional regulator [unclassified Sphingomonas]MDR6113225.1 LacI family transcriptional regulator [Sphingomonas sp. SORGH_AS_0789]MDR6149414.1 LacI family transcriptional regulator [Sphingomonas sp. SORGH_AS_0742]